MGFGTAWADHATRCFRDLLSSPDPVSTESMSAAMTTWERATDPTWLEKPEHGSDHRGPEARRFPVGGPHVGKSDRVAAGSAAQISLPGLGRFTVERRVHLVSLTRHWAGRIGLRIRGA